MYSTTLAMLNDIRFYGLLLKFDQNLAAKVRKGRCPTCGAALHSAPYLRKPHGGPPGLGEEHRKRLSLCCAADGCRQRATPPSLRFLGPKVYWGAWVIVISAMCCGPTPARMRQLQQWCGVSRRTVARWREWWTEVFADSPFWRAAAWMPPVAREDLPAALLERFIHRSRARQLISLLRYLAPITGSHAEVRAM
jgi:hypothetical protein